LKFLPLDSLGKANENRVRFPDRAVKLMFPILARQQPFLNEAGIYTVFEQTQIEISHNLFVERRMEEKDFEWTLHFRQFVFRKVGKATLYARSLRQP
jgi:hypothetical protein